MSSPSNVEDANGGQHQTNKTKEATSSESSKGQGSPCFSCGDSCSKCPECQQTCCFDNKNPEAIVTTGLYIVPGFDSWQH